jgi:hypothetical protein
MRDVHHLEKHERHGVNDAQHHEYIKPRTQTRSLPSLTRFAVGQTTTSK